MKTFINLMVVALSLTLLQSCDNEVSLQKYYVEKQNDNSFITMDLASSLLLSQSNNFTEEQQQAIKSIKKVNMLALKNNKDNPDVYNLEKERLHLILSDGKYKTLMKYGSNTRGATLKFTGEEDAIDEVIVFASDDENGFALFRVLGDDMEPAKMLSLIDGLDPLNFDFSLLQNFGTALN